MALVELRGPVQGHLRPHRLEAGAERGATEPVVGVLQRVGGLACHQTITSASARSPATSYDAPDADVLDSSVSTSFSTSLASPGAIGLADHVAEAEDRPHRVADGLVEFLRRLALVGSLGRLAHVAHSPPGSNAARTWVAASSAEAMQAGMPRPSYAAPHTARPGSAATAARMVRTRSRWPTAYCGRAPPHRCRWVSTGAAVSADGVGEVGQRGRDQRVVVDLEHRLLPVSTDRAAQHEQVAAVGGTTGLAPPSPTWRRRRSPP